MGIARKRKNRNNHWALLLRRFISSIPTPLRQYHNGNCINFVEADESEFGRHVKSNIDKIWQSKSGEGNENIWLCCYTLTNCTYIVKIWRHKKQQNDLSPQISFAICIFLLCKAFSNQRIVQSKAIPLAPSSSSKRNWISSGYIKATDKMLPIGYLLVCTSFFVHKTSKSKYQIKLVLINLFEGNETFQKVSHPRAIVLFSILQQPKFSCCMCTTKKGS